MNDQEGKRKGKWGPKERPNKWVHAETHTPSQILYSQLWIHLSSLLSLLAIMRMWRRREDILAPQQRSKLTRFSILRLFVFFFSSDKRWVDSSVVLPWRLFCSSSSIRSGATVYSRYDSSLFFIPELNCLSFFENFSS